VNRSVLVAVNVDTDPVEPNPNGRVPQQVEVIIKILVYFGTVVRVNLDDLYGDVFWDLHRGYVRIFSDDPMILVLPGPVQRKKATAD